MKRITKNIIITLLIILAGASIVFTMNYAKNHIASAAVNNSDIKPGNTSSDDMPQPPDMNNNNSERPQMPSSDNSNMKEPPQKPDGSSNESSTTEPPAKPEGDSEEQTMDMPSDNVEKSFVVSDKTLTTGYYIVFGIESLILASLIIYLIMSKFNKKTFKETINNFDKVLIICLGTIILTSGFTYISGYVTNNYFLNNTSIENNNKSNNTSSNISSTASLVIEEEKTISTDQSASGEDESIVLVENGGNATINNVTLTKTGGDSTNTENSEFYGVNAGVLVKEESTATIKGATITTNAKGSNAVFATGENAKIYLSDTTIKTTGSSSARGLDATYGGYIEGDNLTITTEGGSCATLATDRGEGTVIVKNSDLQTNGTGSPVIYSTGDISITNTKGVANSAQMVVIEGKNSATVTSSTLSATATGNRGTTDQAGIMIYQSMSGDASVGEGTFTATDSTLEILSTSSYYKSAPMFFITNTNAIINLENNKIIYGSNILISAKGTSEWGNSGSNGGNITLNAKNQELVGDIVVDNISTATINLTKSTYKGVINADNTAKDITISLDKNSTITLTGDSYITTLNDDDTTYSNINFNGYKLYVNGKAIN